MKCFICKQGVTSPGASPLTLIRDHTTVVVKNVPAEVCSNRGEAYIDESIAAHLLSTAEDAAHFGVEVSVREYPSASPKARER